LSRGRRGEHGERAEREPITGPTSTARTDEGTTTCHGNTVLGVIILHRYYTVQSVVFTISLLTVHICLKCLLLNKSKHVDMARESLWHVTEWGDREQRVDVH